MVWNILFSFYLLLDTSSELRAIRFALEKARGKDAIDLFLHIKDTVATVLSIGAEDLVMDNVWIQPQDLAQILSSVFDSQAVSKMHLLSALQNRCDTRGICSGEFAAILLVDFVKTREKEDLARNARLEKQAARKDGTAMLGGKAYEGTREKFALNFDDEEGDLSDHKSPYKSDRYHIDEDGFVDPEEIRETFKSTKNKGYKTYSPGSNKRNGADMYATAPRDNRDIGEVFSPGERYTRTEKKMAETNKFAATSSESKPRKCTPKETMM